MLHINPNTEDENNPNEIMFVYWEDAWNEDIKTEN